MTAEDPWDGDDGDELEAEIMRAEGFRSGGVPLRLRVGRGGVGWALVHGWWCGKRPLVAANARLLSRLGTALPPLPSPYRRGKLLTDPSRRLTNPLLTRCGTPSSHVSAAEPVGVGKPPEDLETDSTCRTNTALCRTHTALPQHPRNSPAASLHVRRRYVNNVSDWRPPEAGILVA